MPTFKCPNCGFVRKSLVYIGSASPKCPECGEPMEPIVDRVHCGMPCEVLIGCGMMPEREHGSGITIGPQPVFGSRVDLSEDKETGQKEVHRLYDLCECRVCGLLLLFRNRDAEKKMLEKREKEKEKPKEKVKVVVQ